MIKKLLSEEIVREKVAIIENEFGDISIDSNRLEEGGVQIKSIREINADANIIVTPWDKLEARDILEIVELNKDNKDIEKLDDHHDHDQASDSFDYCSFETMKTYSKEDLESILKSLGDSIYGKVLRAKGSLLDAIRQANLKTETPCNGLGVCDKCKVIGSKS